MSAAVEVYNRCVTALKEERFEDALSLANEAKALDPAFPHVHLATGIALAGLRRYPEAVDALLDAVEADPQSAVAHSHLGNAFEQLGMYEESIDAGEAMLILGADRSSTLSNMVYQAARICDWSRQRDIQRRLDAHLDRGGVNNMAPFQALVSGASRARQHEAARNYFQRNWGNIEPMKKPGARPGEGSSR